MDKLESMQVYVCVVDAHGFARAAEVLGVPRLHDGPDLEALEQLLITQRPRLFFTQSLAHNPTGSDLSAAKAFRVLQLAQKYDLLIVENDPLADF